MLSHPWLLRARALLGQPNAQQVKFPAVGLCSNSNDDNDVYSAERLLSDKSKQACIRRLSRTKSLRPPSLNCAKEAAVLVPLCIVNDQVSLLYTLRSPFISTHRGQVSFPGGMKDDSDQNFEATALRETEEELGIQSKQIQVWGCCNPMTAKNNISVVPVVGFLGIIDVKKLKINRQEVGEVFTMPLYQLCDLSQFRYTQFRNGYVIPAYLGGKYRVWGLTAGITHVFLSSLLPSAYKCEVCFIKPILSISSSHSSVNNEG